MSGPFVLNHAVCQPAQAAAGAALGPLCHVWLHGMTSAHQTFLNVMQTVADASGIPVVALDLRGHGKSAVPESPTAFTASAMAADVNATLDALQVESCHLLGHSWGSRVAFQFAADYAARIASLVIEDEFVVADHSQGPAAAADAFAARAAEMQRQAVDSFASHDDAIAYFERVSGPAKNLGFDNYERKVGGPGADGRFAALFRPHVAFAWNEHARLADMTFVWRQPAAYPFPVHIMCGGDDASADVTEAIFRTLAAEAAEMADATAGGKPLRTARRVEGAGHVIHRTHPDEFVADLLAATQPSA
jgi:pimeloyl-ACP methyl ester carboxylesterase